MLLVLSSLGLLSGLLYVYYNPTLPGNNIATYTFSSSGGIDITLPGIQFIDLTIPMASIASIVNYHVYYSHGDLYGFTDSTELVNKWIQGYKDNGIRYNLDNAVNTESAATISANQMPVGKIAFEEGDEIRTIDFELNNLSRIDSNLIIHGFVPYKPDYIPRATLHASYRAHKHFHFLNYPMDNLTADQITTFTTNTDKWSLTIGLWFLFFIPEIVEAAAAAAAASAAEAAAAVIAAATDAGLVAGSAALDAGAEAAVDTIADTTLESLGTATETSTDLSAVAVDEAAVSESLEVAGDLDIGEDSTVSDIMSSAKNLMTKNFAKNIARRFATGIKACMTKAAATTVAVTVITTTILASVEAACTKCPQDSLGTFVTEQIEKVFTNSGQGVVADCVGERIGIVNDVYGFLCDTLKSILCCEWGDEGVNEDKLPCSAYDAVLESFPPSS